MNKAIHEIQVQYLIDCIESLTPELLKRKDKLNPKLLATKAGMDYNLVWRIHQVNPDLVAKIYEYNNKLAAYITEEYSALEPKYEYEKLPKKVRVDSPLFLKFLRWYNKGYKSPTVLAKKLNTSRVTTTSYLDRLKDYERQKAAEARANDPLKALREQFLQEEYALDTNES